MNEPDLDRYCKKIITVLTLLQQEYRFNTLHRFLNKHGTRISKPTLSEHLKHLVKQEIVLRKQIGVQEVTYAMNFERFTKLGEASKITKDIVARFFKEEERYKSFPMSEKVDLFYVATVIESLMLLKLELLAISKPENQFEHSLSHYNVMMHFETIRNWLLDELRKNPKEVEQAMKELEDLADQLGKTMYATNKPLREFTKAKRIDW